MNERNGEGLQSENSCARKTDAELISFLKYREMLWREINEYEADAYFEAARRLEDRRWIAVAERLPSRDGKYLAIGPTTDPAKLGVSLAWYTPGKGWSFQNALWCEPSTHETHWMKIPEPPEG